MRWNNCCFMSQRGCIIFACVISASASHAQFATIIDVPPDTAPAAIGSDTQLNVYAAGVISDGFEAGAPDGSSSNVEVNILGGIVGDFFDANTGSVVNISGGVVGNNFDAFGGTQVTISGGSVGDNFDAGLNAIINISGGGVGSLFGAEATSEINISGGIIGDNFLAFNNSDVNLFGRQFLLDGVDITSSLASNTPFEILDRDVPLSGLLADDSPFSFDLNSTFAAQDFFSPAATLSVILVPEPAAWALVLQAVLCSWALRVS